jgi:hypothetical protein
MAAKNIKLQEILVADIDSEPCAEASDVEGNFEEEEENNKYNSKPQQESKRRLQQVADY